MNFQHPLNPLASSLERKFGRFAFPASVRVLSICQLAVLLISMLLPGYESMLALDFFAITEQFQIWRLVTFVFVPQFGLIFAIFAVFILWIINDSLEREWGAFRLNLFLLFSWLGIVAGALIAPLLIPAGTAPQDAAALTAMAAGLGQMAPFVLYSTLFVAFATIYPNHEFLLFFILPVKVKWLALIDAVLLFSMATMGGLSGLIFVVLSMGAYLVVFTPQLVWYLKHSQDTASRLAKFKSGQRPEHEAFHGCAKCGITEQDDAEIDFRIEDDGEEYCVNCLPEPEPEPEEAKS